VNTLTITTTEPLPTTAPPAGVVRVQHTDPAIRAAIAAHREAWVAFNDACPRADQLDPLYSPDGEAEVATTGAMEEAALRHLLRLPASNAQGLRQKAVYIREQVRRGSISDPDGVLADLLASLAEPPPPTGPFADVFAAWREARKGEDYEAYRALQVELTGMVPTTAAELAAQFVADTDFGESDYHAEFFHEHVVPLAETLLQGRAS
jgi:hypothetical protein